MKGLKYIKKFERRLFGDLFKEDKMISLENNTEKIYNKIGNFINNFGDFYKDEVNLIKKYYNK